MTTKYKIVSWKFDMPKFAEVLANVQIHDRQELAGILCVDSATLGNWIVQGSKGRYKQPGMQNFLNACNWLDLDPREFFVLDI